MIVVWENLVIVNFLRLWKFVLVLSKIKFSFFVVLFSFLNLLDVVLFSFLNILD